MYVYPEKLTQSVEACVLQPGTSHGTAGVGCLVNNNTGSLSLWYSTDLQKLPVVALADHRKEKYCDRGMLYIHRPGALNIPVMIAAWSH